MRRQLPEIGTDVAEHSPTILPHGRHLTTCDHLDSHRQISKQRITGNVEAVILSRIVNAEPLGYREAAPLRRA